MKRREFIGSALGGKWVELLKEIAPRTVRVALLLNPATAPVRKHKPSTDSRPQASNSPCLISTLRLPVSARSKQHCGRCLLSHRASRQANPRP
jgi:hypothetical protein